LLAALLIELLAPGVQAEESSEPRSASSVEAPVAKPEASRGASPAPEGDLVALEQHPKAELLVEVQLAGSDPDAQYEIRAFESDAVLLSCHRDCNFRIWPGRYRLLTRTAGGRVLGDDAVFLDDNTRIDVASPSTFELVLGGVTTAAGLTAIVAGLVLYRESPCARSCSDNEATRSQLGIGMMLGGAVTLPVGVVLLESGWTSEVSLTALDASQRVGNARASSFPIRGLRWSVDF
jgi:hypothetical protein